MSKQPEWDAFRYVLDDPTLDRAAFERRMLEDIDVALAVAEAMRHIDLLRTASHSLPLAAMAAVASSGRGSSANAVMRAENARSEAGLHSPGWHWSGLAALAAGLLLAIGGLNMLGTSSAIRSSSLPSVSDAGSLAIQTSIAENWVAFRQPELLDASSISADASGDLVVRDEGRDDMRDGVTTPMPDLPTAGLVSDAEEDWLLDAARDFFAQGTAG